jgi:hypothetical protein
VGLPHHPSIRLPSRPRDLKPENLLCLDCEHADPLVELRLREAVRGHRDIIVDDVLCGEDIEQFDGF